MKINTSTKTIIFIFIATTVVSAAVSIRLSQKTLNQPANLVVYACNAGKAITANYRQGESKPAPGSGKPPIPGGSVVVALSDGRVLSLAQTISADGVRYANSDESFVFWSKGNSTLVLEDNKEKSYIGCIAVAPELEGYNSSEIYVNSAAGFSLRLPSLAIATGTEPSDSYTADESYRYEALGPGKKIGGIKFTIPTTLSKGTNLSSDTYLSVEEIPQAKDCTATRFLDQKVEARAVTDGDVSYSVASSTGAAAGNRYEETVYAFPGTDPCMAVRYFIHYGVIENYPAGTGSEFDKKALLGQFDAIRRTLIIAP